MGKQDGPQRFNKTLISNLQPAPRRYSVADSVVPGLVVHVLPSGKKSFYLRYRHKGRQTNLKIGDAGVVAVDEARRLARQMLVTSAQGDDPALERRQQRTGTLGAFVEGPYAEYVRGRHRAAEQTLKALRSAFGHWFNKSMMDLSPFLIEKWQRERPVKRGRKVLGNRDLARLKAVLSRAVQAGIIAENPLARAKAIREDKTKKIRALSAGEERKLFEAIDLREEERRAARRRGNTWRLDRKHEPRPEHGAFTDFVKPMITVILNCGLRRGEAFSLRWDSVDLDRGTLTIRGEVAKSGQTRVVPLNRVAKEVLVAWHDQTQPAEDGLVFPSPSTGDQLTDIKKIWTALTTTAGIHARLHDLRHTFCSVLLAKGVDLETVRSLAGHSDIATTARYLHTDTDRQKAAVEKLVS